MQSPFSFTVSNPATTVVVLGTGGTIAGTAADAADNIGYTAAQVGVDTLVGSVRGRSQGAVETEQVAQADSKNMSHAIWRGLTLRVAAHLARPEVCGVVVTHGSDTLEETAYFLHRVLAPCKPVVLTAAMRPATSLQADGPQNLVDAITLARQPGAGGVVAVVNGMAWIGSEVRKSHTYRLDAFDAGDAGPLALLEEGRVRLLRPWPQAEPLGVGVLARDPAAQPWPQVDIVTSHGGTDGRVVDLLLQAGVQGLVVAATGNATVHQDLEAALWRARERGVAVLLATRVSVGPVLTHDEAPALPVASGLTPAQARVELLLQLLAREISPR
jgi:L-asparaginase